jgi:membrane-bound inhibitor of C-type lysozyme
MYTVLAYVVIVCIYLFIENSNSNKRQKGLMNIFKGALFQLNRKIQVFMQKHQTRMDTEEWRPAAICISSHSFERDKALDMMKWISYRHGFGTYFHFIQGYYDKQAYSESQELLAKLIDIQKESAFYIDTMISPSYTSALAQVIQAPSISGMENNMVLFEFDKQHPEELTTIINNIPLVKAGNFDVCIFGGSASAVKYRNGIHVWLTGGDEINANLMILLGYIIMAHPDWRKSFIKIFSICTAGNSEETKRELEQRIADGRLPITLTNIEIITLPDDMALNEAVNKHSQHAGITILGIANATLHDNPFAFFTAFDGIGDTLFVNTDIAKMIG